MARPTFTIDGSAVDGIATFYDELNRVFMSGESWQLGPSLDALDDLLYGGLGALVGIDQPRVVLGDNALIREALGVAATRVYYLDKLAQPERFNASHFATALAELEAGVGRTYYELVLAVFADHPEIELVLA